MRYVLIGMGFILVFLILNDCIKRITILENKTTAIVEVLKELAK